MALIGSIGLALAGCETMGDAGDAMMVDLRSTIGEESQADLALASLAKGDYGTAEVHIQRALALNPRDPYALLAAGILYQNTDREMMAARVYQEIMALRPEDQAAIGNWFRQRPRSITDIAEANLEILSMLPETAGVAGASMMDPMRDPTTGESIPMGAPMAFAGSASGAPQSLTGTSPAFGSAAANAMPAPMEPLGRIPTAATLDPASTSNIAQRFAALQALYTDGLITQEEYARRRAANLGALLPMTQRPPAVGLGRPSPRPDEVVGRLKALRATLQRGAMTPEQHAAERTAILAALLPEDPVQRAPVMLPPTTLTDGAAAQERVRALKDMGVVSDAEMKTELAAIDRSVKSSATMAGPPPKVVVAPGTTVRSGGGARSGIHLASYKSEAMAKRGWAELRSKYPSILGKLTPHLSRANLGAKGVFLRLKAGPLRGKGEAQAVCAKLKAAGQYCVPTSL
ncbi:SPOR domain-containing protein [Rhodospirillum sp. A1_3_36]|uniref:SPOR domain-containing protein n=1 Tax=Rhodospirillum sp. A1_3_36 TaxID=3391666 RepID=UPI0039A51162